MIVEDPLICFQCAGQFELFISVMLDEELFTVCSYVVSSCVHFSNSRLVHAV